MAQDPKSVADKIRRSANMIYVANIGITGALVYGAYKVRPVWAKVVFGGLALLRTPAVIMGPTRLGDKLIEKYQRQQEVRYTAGGLQPPEDPVKPAPATGGIGYGSPFAAAVLS